MKRQLQNAYDHMTMPDDCARRIQQQLELRQEQQRTGQNFRMVPPSRGRNRSWVTAAVAVCLMLVLSVGGSVLYLGAMEPQASAPKETKAAAPGAYSLVTDLPPKEVEAFAEAVRENLLNGDWEAFAQQVSYPISVLDKSIGNAGGLVGLLIRNTVREDFLEEIREETCEVMFCSWQGVCMGGGQLWINEVNGELKITAINGLFTDIVDTVDFSYAKLPDGTWAVESYSGWADTFSFVSGVDGIPVTRIGTGSPVIQNGSSVQVINIPETVQQIGDRAFADCPALEAVYFLGDAPAEADGVFDGTENVTVCYQKGTSGWGETWCGRKTTEYTSTYISLGTAVMDAEWSFLGILKETAEFHSSEQHRAFTISEYCQERGEALGATVTVPKCTLVDMDRDGVKELVLWVDIEGDAREDYLILRCNHEGDGSVYTLLEPQQQITDLKKDGSFRLRGNGPDQRESILLRDGDVIRYLEHFSTVEKAPVQWHGYTSRPEAVIASYQYVTGTGWGRFPGTACVYLELLAKGEKDNNWPLLKEELTAQGLICQEEGKNVFVYDPDAPCCQFYGTVNEAGQFLTIGYYISNEYGERQAEIRELLSGDPVYMTGVNLEELDAHGREAAGLKEVMEYLS